MRIAHSLLLATALVLGAHALASGDESGGDDMDQMKARLDALELETEYLRSREAALTNYIMLNKARSNAMLRSIRKTRDEGFEMNRIPAPSRVTLMSGLEVMAASLQKDLPTVSKSEGALLKKADATRKLSGR